MGIFRRPAPLDLDAVAVAVAEKVKALVPAGPVAPVPLPREEVFGQGLAFNPGVPLTPAFVDPREPGGSRPAPRRNEFAQSVNLQVQSTKLVPFKVLRDVGDRVDIIRECIKVRKAQMLAFDWDITLTRQALKRLMITEGISSPGKASQLARARFEPEMARLREWWEKPDPLNGFDFTTWLGMLLEEQLVIDAVALWPRRNLGGDVVSVEVLDGATIKPLLDHRGARPVSPNPAYQQVLYGFPRGEFTASDSLANDGYRADQLVYRPRHVRSWTPYGFSEVESALPSADIYLKRMAWVRGEFTEGTTPDTWLALPESSTMKPDMIKAFEAAINAELAGNIAERHHLHMLPPGTTPTPQRDFSEGYSTVLDELCIKLMCSAFDVMPTEIGFPPNSGIGGKGHQEGEANSAMRKAVRPTATWLNGLLTDISRLYLGMPNELQFTFLAYEVEDQETDEKVTDSQVRRGGKTLNESRAEVGLPMFDFEEADEPFLVTGSGVVFLRGAIAAQAAAVPAPGLEQVAPVPAADPVSATDPKVGDDVPEVGDPIGPDEPVPDGFLRVAGHLRRKPGAVGEASKFLTFAAKRQGRAWRDFTFADVDAATGAALNAAGRSGDLQVVKALVADVGKARARIVGPAQRMKLVDAHAGKIAEAVAGLFPSVDGFDPDEDDAEEYGSASDDFDELDGELEEFYRAGHRLAFETGGADGDPVDDGRLTRLLDSIPGSREILVGAATALIVDNLRSDTPQTVLADVVGPQTEVFAGVEATVAFTAGSLDSAEKQGLARVRIVADDGDCDFCEAYSGRVLELDDDSGMPPLHRGCQCDIEPLD